MASTSRSLQPGISTMLTLMSAKPAARAAAMPAMTREMSPLRVICR